MQRYCLKCEVDWDDPTHRRAVRRDVGSDWRGNPGQMVPHRQWTRENLPDSGQRLSVAGDDGFVRTWWPDDYLGIVAPSEWKTFGAPLDTPTDRTFKCVAQGRVAGWFAVRLHEGNVPSPLRHYPSPCCCGLPEQPLVAKRIDVQWHPIGGEPIRRTDISAPELVAGILAFIQWEAA